MINKEAQEAWEAGYLAGRGLIKEASPSLAEVKQYIKDKAQATREFYLNNRTAVNTAAGGLAGAGVGGAINGWRGAGMGTVTGAGVGLAADRLYQVYADYTANKKKKAV